MKVPSSKVKVLRKYKTDFLEFGFVNKGSKAEPRSQCVQCEVTVANEAEKPSKLRRRLNSKHLNLVGKPVDVFKMCFKSQATL